MRSLVVLTLLLVSACSVECYDRPRPDLALETKRQTYPSLVNDPPLQNYR